MTYRGGSGARRRALAVALAVLTVSGMTACGGVQGQARTPGDVAGLPVTHFESGLKPDAPDPGLKVRNVTDSEEDRLASSAIADVEAYWGGQLPADFGQEFQPVKSLLSYDSRADSEETECGNTKDLVNAFYCPPDDSVAWDRGELLPMLRTRFGPMSVVTVLAHEFGHAIQYRLKEKAGIDRGTPTIVKEQQADCFAGSYFRWVAEGKSKFYQVSTAEGLNQVLASMFFIRDQAGSSATDKQAHGTAFDRTFAFQSGFAKGPKDCAGMNEENVKARITEQPFSQGQDKKQQGDTRIDQNAIDYLKKSLDQAFQSPNGPQIMDQGAKCPDGKGTPPASYCQENNTVSIDLQALAALGQPVDRQAEFEGKDPGGMGDFAVFAEVASRYALGIQKNAGIPLDNNNAGLRTSCLVGAWAASTNGPNNVLRLSPGDLDEAMADLLQPNGLVSADVNGNRPANGFERVESLRLGYLQGSPVCSQRYP